ncbi:uncharacterized protein [Setaria viridis]|uniref:uncharacterized protein n=1 Tax=Setaria viridis TaxID=4556 RepID=UPI001493C92C|nr:uncharacterized protein LOC117849294 [Setaria viridis]
MTFPNIESEENPTVRRRCTSFSEAVSIFSGCQLTATKVAEYFQCFYNGFSEETTSCCGTAIRLRSTADSSLLRWPREIPDELTKGLDYSRLCDKVPDSSTIDLNNWIVAPFAVQPFKSWWAEWKQHLFCASPVTYCNDLDPENIDPTVASESRPPPKRSQSGRSIENRYPYTEFPLIGHHAPTIDDITIGRLKQTPKKTLKKTSRRVRARTESADQSAAASAESLVAPILPVIEEVDPQAATEADTAVASLLLEAVQAAQITPGQPPQQSATPQAEIGAPVIPPTEATLGTSIVPFQQPSAREPTEEVGPSRGPIIVESSSSDKLVAPVPEPRAALPPAQAEEMRFKEEKDTPNNSLFSFAVALSDDEEVASRQVTLSSIPDDVRAKLESIRTLLQDDIG